MLGVSVYDPRTTEFEVRPGPIFTNVVLADEINRAPPRTQSGLLQAMQEGRVTLDDRTFALPSPFLVMATQNPLEHHGTYPLPESQLDRFLMRLTIGYPGEEAERRILLESARSQPLLEMLEPVLTATQVHHLQEEVEEVHADDAIVDHLMEIVRRTRSASGFRMGVSPRGAIALFRARARVRAHEWTLLPGAGRRAPSGGALPGASTAPGGRDRRDAGRARAGGGAPRAHPGRDRGAAVTGVRRAWASLRAWRRIRFTFGGLVFSLGALAVGFAAMNTANNLLYLLLGAMLGLIVVSSWLSEQAIRGLDVRRHTPYGVTVGHEVRIQYEVINHKRRLSSLAVELREQGLPGTAFLPRVGAGEETTARSANRFVRRGIYPLGTVTISTSFPFGLFLKERDVEIPGELVIWPRHDRALRAPAPGAGKSRALGIALTRAAGTRGDYRGLREYRPRDDPKDIHWRSSARFEVPVVREYDRDSSESLWICLDLAGQPSEESEALVEVTASLAARAQAEGKRFGLVVGGRTVPPARRARGSWSASWMRSRAWTSGSTPPPPAPPVDPSRCILVSLAGRDAAAYADAFVGAPPVREEAA